MLSPTLVNRAACAFSRFMTRRTTIFFLNFQLGQNSDVILSRYIFGGRGIRGGVCENNANRFTLRMADLLVFIHNGGIKKLLYCPDLKNGTHFPCHESHPKEYSKCVLPPHPLRKNRPLAVQLKSPFGDSCF